jgi:hypothetical protein
MSVCVDYYYFVLVLFPLIGISYVSLCGLLLFCFGTVPSREQYQSKIIVIHTDWHSTYQLKGTVPKQIIIINKDWNIKYHLDVDYYYFVLVLFPLIGISYVSLCGLLLFCFGTIPSNWYVICQSVWIIIILFWN